MKTISPGDVLLTTYGVGVFIKTCPSVSEKTPGHNVSLLFKARLWREPKKSVGSSATAFLRFDSILKKIPVAPGCITALRNGVDKEKNDRQGKVLIHGYSQWNDTYIVSNVTEDSPEQRIKDSSIIQTNHTEGNTGIEDSIAEILVEVKSSEVEASKSSKFYPLIDQLIDRGNEASASAKAVIRENPKLRELMSHNGDIASSEPLKNMTNNIENTTSSLKSALPNAEEVNKIYKMLKDEELTVLLEKAGTRLRQLSSLSIPKATEDALRQMGVEVNQSNETHGIPGSIAQSRKEALDAVDKLLAKNLDMDIKTIKSSLGSTFENMYDSLSTAAESDSSLSSILNDINVKTSEWQKETGRIFETRSSCLFFEGAQRLRHRFTNLFSSDQLAWAEHSASNFTKAFSEGDVALARLKSIELGESIRSRLIKAIEIRSDSEGGLDAIIAGAINKGANGLTDGKVQSLMASLQTSVSSRAASTHESLISLLSERSKYQDIVIVRLERVLLDLDDNFGKDLSAEEIAAMARGETGTAALFAPIARRASNEIEKQLNAAEQSVTDPTFVSVLSHIRRIISGNLTMSSLIDEISIIFNDEKVVRKGEIIIQRGEHLLDAIENVSENRAVGDMMAVVEKAGFTKDSVLGKMENLNVNELLETAEGAYSDEKKRHALLSSATDTALEFLLKILPSMPVPNFDGVKDGLIYSITKLSMHGFKVKKEDIMVEISGIRAAEQSVSTKREIRTSAEHYPEYENEVIDPLHEEVDDSIASQDPDSKLNTLIARDVKSTELLIIDVRNISASFDKACWSFEQTYMPYLKKSGQANVKLSDGHIRLQFELRKKLKKNKEATGNEINKWEPVLCLHQRTCTIGNVDLIFEGEGRITWLINKLASMLRRPLRDYVVSVLLATLSNQSGWLLENLNSILSSYWDLILKTAGLTMDDLAEASEDDVIASSIDPLTNEVDLVWTEFVPLGINLLTERGCNLQVVDFPRGSQARRIALLRDLDPDIFMGATILAVNGTMYGIEDRSELFAALKDPSRPKTIKFLLCQPHELDKARNLAAKIKKTEATVQSTANSAVPFAVKSINITNDGPIGIKFAKSIDGCALVIEGFSEEGCIQSFEQSGSLQLGDLLIHINGDPVVGGSGSWIDKCLESLGSAVSKRPLCLGFAKPYLKSVRFEKSADSLVQSGGPEEEFILEEKALPGKGNRIYLKCLQDVDGSAEAGGIFIGDRLLFINGNPVGSGYNVSHSYSSIDDVHRMLQDQKSYPCGFTFARPNCSGVRNVEFCASASDLQTFSIAATSYSQLGFKVSENTSSGDVIVTEFHGVRGYFQENLSGLFVDDAKEIAIESIDGQSVPSYATSEIVMNAMKRNWNKNGKLEILFCNDEERRWMSSL